MPEIIQPSIDGLVLASIARELRAHVGARFAGVRQPDPQAVVLALRGPGGIAHLYGSIHPRTARVHLTTRPRATEHLTPFGQLLRSRLTHSRLDGVEQPPFDRVLRLRFDALQGPLTMIAEIMGRYSNMILTDGRVVLGALKVVTPRMSPRRPVLPGRPYVPPPADRPGPDQLDETALCALCNGPRPIWQQLMGAVLGVGPVLAREVALRAGVDPQTPAGDAAAACERLHAALRELTDIARMERFSPVAYEHGGRTVAFAAVPLRVYADLSPLPVASMSEALERYYRDLTEVGPLEEHRRALQRAARGALQQREHALEENRRALDESAQAERYRLMGDLLLAYAGHAGPGADSVVVPDHTAGGSEITIALDPGLTAVENARLYFRRYAKARAAARAVPDRIARLEDETLALRGAFVQIVTAESLDDLSEIEGDLAHSGMLRSSPRRRPVTKPGPRRFCAPGGATIIVGRSARENDHVTFHIAAPDDLWLHARGLAGAHVVLKTAGIPSEEAIWAAAQVAAYFSEGREAGLVAVDCVARKHVRKPRGATPGTVTYSEERTVRVTPALPPRSGDGQRVGGG